MKTYEVRKNNGVFHVFNAFLYTPVAAYLTEFEALDHVWRLLSKEASK